MNKETSSEISTLASAILRLPAASLSNNFKPTPDDYNNLLTDARKLAGSALSQDETPGQAPETFHDRLQREFYELQERVQKLTQFLIVGAPGVSNDQRELLDMQLDAMKIYHAVLKMRLAGPEPGAKHYPEDFNNLNVASAELGEPVETGGHDEDRDGPIPFNG